MKYISLGQQFVFQGKIAVCVLMEFAPTCGNCIFNERHNGCRSPFYCTPAKRKDKKNVKFIQTK